MKARARPLPSSPQRPQSPAAEARRYTRTWFGIVGRTPMREGCRLVCHVAEHFAIEAGSLFVFMGKNAVADRISALRTTGRPMAPRSVRRSLREAVALGLLVLQDAHNPGGRLVGGKARANVYKLHIPVERGGDSGVLPTERVLGGTLESSPARSNGHHANTRVVISSGGDSGVPPSTYCVSTESEEESSLRAEDFSTGAAERLFPERQAAPARAARGRPARGREWYRAELRRMLSTGEVTTAGALELARLGVLGPLGETDVELVGRAVDRRQEPGRTDVCADPGDLIRSDPLVSSTPRPAP